MVSSFREYDSKAEQVVARFLDKHFYSRPDIKDFVRFTAKEDQLKGKDLRFSWLDNQDMVVDEKAQIYYVNKNIPTFAFEIDFIRSKDLLTQGWLFDKDKETQYYLLIWITSKKEKNFMEEDITQLECILIKREDLIVFLHSQGLDFEKVREISKSIRIDGSDGRHMENNYDSCYFFFSKRLAEMPVNIIIRKQKLKELATKTFLVKRLD